jgi:hypothetical protein
MTKPTLQVIRNELGKGIIKPMRAMDFLGKTLNPRAVRGWKDAYIDAISKTKQYSIAEFYLEYGVDLSRKTQKQAICEIKSILKVEGIGTTPTATYNYATKMATKQFKEANWNNEYENTTAILWERLDPNWTEILSVRLENGLSVYMIVHGVPAFMYESHQLNIA